MSGSNSIDVRDIMGKEEGLADVIANHWTRWKTAKMRYEDRLDEVRNYVFATSTKETTNVSNPFSNTTHIPKITQIYDNLNANYFEALFPNEDWLKFEGEDNDSVLKEKRDAIEAYLKTKHRVDKFQRKVAELLNDWVLYGNCFAGVTYVRETHVDPDTGEEVVGYQGPRIYRIDPKDIVFNVNATDFESSPKIIRSLKTLGELARDAEENPHFGYSEDALKKAKETRTKVFNSDLTLDNSRELEFDGFGSLTEYLQSGYVEILELYGDVYDVIEDRFLKNHVVTVIDRTWVVRAVPLDTWSGKPHIFHTGWRSRPNNLWAMGPLENLVGMQYRINLLENGKADAFDQMLDPDRVIIGDVETIIDGPKITYYAAEGGNVHNLSPDTTMLNADFQIKEIENKMEEFAGAPRQSMGIRTPGEKTAFEVQQLATAASRLFQHKISSFEEEFLEKIVNAEVELARRFIDASDLIKIVDEDIGVEQFLTVTADDLKANGRLVPKGARHFAERAKLVQELVQLQNTVLQDPEVKQHISSKALAKAMVEDILDFSRLELYQPNVRIFEQFEAQQLINQAQEELAVENETSAEVLENEASPISPDQGNGPVPEGTNGGIV